MTAKTPKCRVCQADMEREDVPSVGPVFICPRCAYLYAPRATVRAAKTLALEIDDILSNTFEDYLDEHPDVLPALQANRPAVELTFVWTPDQNTD